MALLPGKFSGKEKEKEDENEDSAKPKNEEKDSEKAKGDGTVNEACLLYEQLKYPGSRS